MAALTYDTVFSANASVQKARGYLLASDYDPDSYEENPERKVRGIHKKTCLDKQ